MSVRIYIREAGGDSEESMFVMFQNGQVALSKWLNNATPFPNLCAAKEAHEGFRHKTVGVQFEMVAIDIEADPNRITPMGELDDLEEVPRVPIDDSLTLYAALRKSSKYHHQFSGWQPVTRVIPPSYGDHYCFRVAHNAYRHEDLIFAIKVRDEFVRLDKWVAPKTGRRAA